MNKPGIKHKKQEHPTHTNILPTKLLMEIEHALSSVGSYGSIELYVQNNIVTQITARHIKKTNLVV